MYSTLTKLDLRDKDPVGKQIETLLKLSGCHLTYIMVHGISGNNTRILSLGNRKALECYVALCLYMKAFGTRFEVEFIYVVSK